MQLSPHATAADSGQTFPDLGTRRERAKKGQGDKLREDILLATERLILESGDEASVSIRSIASAAGITPPSIYLHFDDRNELMFAVTERQWDRLDDQMTREIGDRSDPLQRVVARGRAYLRFGLDNPEFYRILMMSRPAATPARFSDIRLIATSRLNQVVDDISHAVEMGALGPCDPYDAACLMWVTIHGLVSLLIAKPEVPLPEPELMFEQLVRTLLEGMGSSSPQTQVISE